MPHILQIVLPMFVLIGLGCWAARYGGFTAPMTQGLSRFLGAYALPALLVSSMAQADIATPIEWRFLASFYIAALLTFLIGSAWMMALRRWHEIAPVGLASSFSNIALLGAPILMDAYGPGVTAPIMVLIAFQSPILITLATLVAETQRGAGGHPLRTALRAAWGTVTSPLVLSVAVGLVLNITKIPVPGPVLKSMSLLGQTVLPGACFALGATIAASALRGKMPMASSLALMKVAVHPCLTWVLAAVVFRLPPEWVAPAVTASALPCGINAYMLAERYGAAQDLVSMALVISVLLSPISISLAVVAASG